MTEAEAKAKWCPFARVASDEFTSGAALGGRTAMVGWNRRERESFGHRENIGGENHCMGSKCMAWRWTTSPATETKLLRQIDRDAPVEVTREVPGEGFCGLAGDAQ